MRPCVHAQDAIIAVGSSLILTRPGAPERRPEVPPVRAAAEALLLSPSEVPPGHPEARRLMALTGPSLLDGGDVMFDGCCLWVGLTARTNARAVAELSHLLGPQGVTVVGLPVRDPAGNTLHLKVEEG